MLLRQPEHVFDLTRHGFFIARSPDAITARRTVEQDLSHSGRHTKQPCIVCPIALPLCGTGRTDFFENAIMSDQNASADAAHADTALVETTAGSSDSAADATAGQQTQQQRNGIADIDPFEQLHEYFSRDESGGGKSGGGKGGKDADTGTQRQREASQVDNSGSGVDEGGDSEAEAEAGTEADSGKGSSDAETTDAESGKGSDKGGDKGSDKAGTEDDGDGDTDGAGEADNAKGEEADFGALEGKTGETADKKFLSADELKAKHPRNSSKDLIADAAAYSAEAKRLTETVDALGGEEYVPALTKISEGLRNGDSRSIFEGIIAGNSSEGLLTVLGDAADLLLFRGDHFASNPETADFGKALKALGDMVVQKRFGDSVTLDSIERMAQLAELGWIDHINKWGEAGWVDADEADDLLKAGNDPKLRAKMLENAQLKAQLDAKQQEARQAQAERAGATDAEFQKAVTDQISEVLNTVVLRTSILRDIEGDTAEMKAEKAFLRDTILNRAIEMFNGNAETRSQLAEWYRQGKAPTAVYRSAFANAINTAILQTKAQTALGEQMLAKMYRSTRNTQLLASSRSSAKGKGHAQAQAASASSGGNSQVNSGGLTPTAPALASEAQQARQAAAMDHSMTDIDDALRDAFERYG